MSDLKNKVALVTGASRGIGRQIALEFAKAQAIVVVNYSSNEAEAKKTLELMGENLGQSFAMKFDVSDEALVDKAVAEIKDRVGPIDILVNNAGVAVDGLIMRLKSSDFDRQMNINLKGAFNCTKSSVRHMIKNKSGRIINISSIVGQMGNPGQSVYAACKAGLIGMTKSLAKELASRNILVNAVTPGYIATDMTKSMIEKNQEEINKHIPLGRVGCANDIANAVKFLASKDASYITGQVLSVNGGIYM